MKIYVTFGQIHKHEIHGKIFDRDCVAVVYGDDFDNCYDIVRNAFGKKYAFTYDEPPDMKFYPRGFINLNPRMEAGVTNEKVTMD